jgi:hypothetical protein
MDDSELAAAAVLRGREEQGASAWSRGELAGGISCAMGGASTALKNGACAMERRVELLQSMEEGR